MLMAWTRISVLWQWAIARVLIFDCREDAKKARNVYGDPLDQGNYFPAGLHVSFKYHK